MKNKGLYNFEKQEKPYQGLLNLIIMKAHRGHKKDDSRKNIGAILV